MRLAGDALERGRLVLDFDVDDIRELDVGTLARVVRAAEHGVTEQPVWRHAELSEARANRGLECALGVVEGEFDFA
ncbi:hypothetical protein OH687_18170 [Burkholderia anthina]|nr:hypothetical protein OH687_18170 [Burkholderia anthina]